MNPKIDEANSTAKGGSTLLWQKADVRVDAKILALMGGEDVLLDREFLPFDIEASKVHVEGLARIGILNSIESEAITNELAALANDFRDGKFVLDNRFEDGHSAIETRLVEKLGDIGKKVHTGRSRNDQVLVATRLWLKEQLMELEKYCIQIATICLDRTQQNSLPMPGYTHLQRAVVSSTGMWFAGWAESFMENAKRANHTREWIDKNPLGTAAGYGVNLPLDRAFCTTQLGFAQLHCSPIAAQLSRGKFEMAALEAFCTTFLDVRRLAWDLSLFSTAEFDFIILPSEFTTGSSIMPNKRNPDVVELLRGSYARVSAARNEIEQLLSLPSGYQRDLQISKSPLVHGCHFSLEMLSIVPILLSKLGWNEQKMRAAIEPAMYSTDIALELAIGGTPFRDAYRQAAAEISKMKSQQNCLNLSRTPEQSLTARISPGAAGNPQNELIQMELDELKGLKNNCN